MKLLKILSTVLLAALLSAAPAFSQAALTSTTLSAAVTDTVSQSVVLASATNVSAGGFLYSGGEVMQVRSSYVSGTTIPVNRGVTGTRAVPHLSGDTVYVVAPGNQARTGFLNYDPYGGCTRGNQSVLPVINVVSGNRFDCFGGFWFRYSLWGSYGLNIVPGAQPSAASPTIGTAITITGQAGGAQSATTSNGAAGAAFAFTGGIGGVGGTSSGTGGAGGALTLIGGAGAGTITGGAGGALTLGAGAGANGSSAGGSGGALAAYSGAKGTGGTGTDGAISIKQGGAAGTSVFATSTAGATTVASAGTAQSVTLTPSTSGTIKITGGTDSTKVVSIDASGNTTGITQTIASAATVARTLTLPDATDTLVGKATSDSLSNKTIPTAGIGFTNATSGTVTVAATTGALGTPTVTLPAQTGSLPSAYFCGATSGSQACANTATGGTARVFGGIATLSGSSAVISGISPAFTSTSTYTCVANDLTTRANPVQVANTSSSSITITNTTGATDVINYICVGY